MVVLLTAVLSLFSGRAATASPKFIAYSMREAAVRAENGRFSSELMNLGGITRIGGMVYDRDTNDPILLGLVEPNLPVATLDDLVVALRARILYGKWPLVSIDPVPETEKTGLQVVRFDGNLENTEFGRSFLDSDIILKRYSLHLIKTIPRVPSYNTLLEDDIREATKSTGAEVTQVRWYSASDGAALCEGQHGVALSSSESYQSRFWFYVLEPYVYAYKGNVFGIKELRLALKSEGTLPDTNTIHSAQQRFPIAWTEHFDEMTMMYPVLRRFKVLYDITAVAEIIRSMENLPDIHFLVEHYVPRKIETEETYKMEELYGIAERTDDQRHLIRISGGIQLKTEIKWMNDGDFTPLYDIVLKSRPSPDSLTWPLSLDGWKMQNARDLKLGSTDGRIDLSVEDINKAGGCSIVCQSVTLNPKLDSDDDSVKRFSGFPPPPPPPPPLGGVSMQMKVSDESFEKDNSGNLDKRRKDALKSRPNKDSLTWPAKKKED